MIHKAGFIARANRWSSHSWRQTLMQDPCVYCGGAPLGLDHIRAAAKRGHNGWENLAPACGRCNNEKGTLELLRYLIHRRAGLMPPSVERQERRRPLIPRQYQIRPLRVRIHEHLGLPYPENTSV
jgi:5-methylcytosine-specific restriction endonuclease McrA